jgi:ribosomal protein L31E
MGKGPKFAHYKQSVVTAEDCWLSLHRVKLMKIPLEERNEVLRKLGGKVIVRCFENHVESAFKIKNIIVHPWTVNQFYKKFIIKIPLKTNLDVETERNMKISLPECKITVLINLVLQNIGFNVSATPPDQAVSHCSVTTVIWALRRWRERPLVLDHDWNLIISSVQIWINVHF